MSRHLRHVTAALAPVLSAGVEHPQDRLIEGKAGRVPTREDSLRVGLLLGNAVAAACFGPRGGWRDRIDLGREWERQSDVHE